MRTKEGNKEKDIIEAAVEVFAQRGYHNAKIAEIAKAADVSTGTVYLYFESKEKILKEIFKQLWLDLTTKTRILVQRSDIDAITKFEGMIDLVLDLFGSNPSLAMVFVNEQNQLMRHNQGEFAALYGKYLDLGQKVLSDGIRERMFNEHLDVNVIRQFVFGGVRNLVHQWAEDPREFSLNTIRVNVKQLMKDGILRRGKK